MTKPCLETSVVDGLTLNDPFIIASSHWTGTESVFRKLAVVNPAALTLKTSSAAGGDGKETTNRGREKKDIKGSSGSLIAKYTDGPKEIELWDLPTTYEMTRTARKLLPSTRLGLSVLKGEDYQACRQILGTEHYAYVELNWKYAFRGLDQAQPATTITEIENDLNAFLNAFHDLPRIVKLPRESIPYIGTPALEKCLAVIKGAGAALLVANSRRLRVPPSRVASESPRELSTGVIVGEYLFIETFDTLRRLASGPEYRQRPLPMIATGGIMDIAGIIDMFAAGANAVQLCTILDVRGIQVLELLREQLAALISASGSFQTFLADLRQQDSVWFSAVQRAKSIEASDQETVASVASDVRNLRPVFEEALAAELTLETREVPVLEPVDLPLGLSIVVNYANIGSFFLSVRAAHEHRMTRIDAEGVREFANLMKDPFFMYDFVILPQSAINNITNHPPHGAEHLIPVPISSIGRSTWEIAGDRQLSDELETVYHFGGRSARIALQEFLRDHKPDTQQIDPAKLLPSLKFWRDSFGILAKPPLSRMYGLLASKDVASRWTHHWRWSEPLVLACSTHHHREHGKKHSDKLASSMCVAATTACGNVEAAVDALLATDFAQHCARLLQSSRRV
jgi:dihydroorotate dehydrogenase